MDKIDLENRFIEIIRKNERIIYKVCSFYFSDELPLSDLYQETVCNLWTAFPKFRNECTISTWIYRIALNTCVSGLRKETRQPKGMSASALYESLPAPEDMSEQIKEMYRLIHQLKTMEKAIVLLYLEEKSYQEIADITGLTVSNVATKLKRSKEKLKQMSNL
ncbi:RNA polymerase sigma factor [Dysgonomonas sp. ZJ709]|uniref:RNA polymerase sigma factor n=1 Tax=Dysgonomonas sp. ZJ709 TaxID=2709797 RepID=UPI0013EDC128|nr:sigma-70 family RNA polymerase sigma factor [Dysgonomonas sp. ZJ709]